MKVLVTGASGFLGREVVKDLLRQGHTVRAMVRPASPDTFAGDRVEIFRADLRTSSNLAEAVSGMDALIHLAAAVTGDEDQQFASTVIGTERLMAAMEGSAIRRVVHVSSIAIYDWGKLPAKADESAALAANVYEMGGYSIAKYWQEKVVTRAAAKNGWELAVLRPGFIWGPDHTDIAGAGRGMGPLHLVFNPGNRLPLTHVANCADCVVRMLAVPKDALGIYNVVDGFNVSAWRFSGLSASQSSRRRVRIPVPYAIGRMTAAFSSWLSRKLFGPRARLPSLLVPARYQAQFKSVDFSTERLKRNAGWTPPVSLEDCIAASFSPAPRRN